MICSEVCGIIKVQILILVFRFHVVQTSVKNNAETKTLLQPLEKSFTVKSSAQRLTIAPLYHKSRTWSNICYFLLFSRFPEEKTA